jgi:hypothetical protein
MQGFVHSRPFAIALRGAVVGVLLAACAPRYDKAAAADIVVFLAAAQSGNRTVFEDRVDREAVRDDLRAQFNKLPGVKELQAELGEGVGDGALDRMISPDVIERLAKSGDAAGFSLATVGPRLRPIGKGRLCLRDAKVKDRCLLTFAKAERRWKLVGLHAESQSFEPPAAGAGAPRTEEAVD